MKKDKENEQKEELQTRREFFKKAAKRSLPILGALLISSNPIIASTLKAEPEEQETGCSFGCTNSCSGYCGRSCSYGCSGSCSGSCSGACKGGCSRSCSYNCSGSSSGWGFSADE